jgi:subtilisin family serine protease
MRKLGIKILNIYVIAAMVAMFLPQVVWVNEINASVGGEGEYRQDIILAKFVGDDEVHRVSVFPYETVEETIARVGSEENVEYAETDAIYQMATIHTNDWDFPKQWHLEQIGATNAWDFSTGSKDVVIALLDSGVDITHPDLKNNIWKNPGEIAGDGRDNDGNGYIDDINGWSFVEKDNDPNPRFKEGWTKLGVNHGTIVAGILGAEGNNDLAIAGVAWNASIMPLRVLASDGSGDAKDVVDAINYAIVKKADILNLSFVGFSYNKTLESAIERAHNAGMLIVAAAGNDVSGSRGFNMDANPMYPVCYDGPNGDNWILGVTALDPLDQRAYFSSYGHKCIDVAAPGVGLWSTVAYRPNLGFTDYAKGYWTGTSVAVPQVSGIATLLWALRPSLSAKEISELIMRSANSIDEINADYKGKLGSGRVNALTAIRELRGENVSSISVLINSYILSAPLKGAVPEVKIFSTAGREIKSFMAYNKNFKGGVEIASADIDGDGYPEIITTAGPGGGPHVRIFRYDGVATGGFFAYSQNVRNGIYVAAGDLDRNGIAEIITGSGAGMKPEVKIFNADGTLVKSFSVFGETFRGGVKVAIVDFEGDNFPEIVVGAGAGGDPRVSVYRDDGYNLSNFKAFPDKFHGGVNLGVADLDGDKKEELVVGGGTGSSVVKVFDMQGKERISFYAYDTRFKGGVRVASIDIDMDGHDEILTGPAESYPSKLRIFNSLGLLISNISAYGKDVKNGISVAGMRK